MCRLTLSQKHAAQRWVLWIPLLPVGCLQNPSSGINVQHCTFVRASLSEKRKHFVLEPNVKQKCMCLYHIQRQMKQKETSFSLRLGTGVKQRAFSDWHLQRVPCQSYAQSISSSQSVRFVCWICFGTCRPLIDMGAGAGKTLLWCEANNGPSVALPQMFGLGGYTGIIVVQKSGLTLSCSHSLSFLSPSSILFCS